MSWLAIVQKVVDEGAYAYINKDTHEEVSDVEYVSENDEDYVDRLKPHNNKNTVLLDGYTASMLIKITNGLNEKNRERFTNLPILKAVKIGWELHGWKLVG